jgi:F0F1-type ATP synthase assembly protein I
LNLVPHKRNSGDGLLGKGMDLALTTLVFLGIGYLLDRWLGTRPVFMVVCFLLAFAGQTARLWYDYEARMKVLEADRADRSRPRR